MYPEAGGSSSFARHAFNELVSFFAAWGQMLNYIITVAISAFFVPHYLAVFWEPLGEGPGDVIGGGRPDRRCSPLLNVKGTEESTRLNLILAIADLFTQVLLVADRPLPRASTPTCSSRNVELGRRADLERLRARDRGRDDRLHGDRDDLEHVRGGARTSRRRSRAGTGLTVLAVFGLYALLPLIALSAMPVEQDAAGELHDRAGHDLRRRPGARDRREPRARRRADRGAARLRRDPRGGDPDHRHQRRADRRLAADLLDGPVPPAARSACARSTRASARRTSRSWSSPAVRDADADPGARPSFLATLYSFGAMLSFTIAHVSVIRLRQKYPDAERRRGSRRSERPRVRRVEVPLTAVLGGLGTFARVDRGDGARTRGRSSIGGGWMVARARRSTSLYRRYQGLLADRDRQGRCSRSRSGSRRSSTGACSSPSRTTRRSPRRRSRPPSAGREAPARDPRHLGADGAHQPAARRAAARAGGGGAVEDRAGEADRRPAGERARPPRAPEPGRPLDRRGGRGDEGERDRDRAALPRRARRSTTRRCRRCSAERPCRVIVVGEPEAARAAAGHRRVGAGGDDRRPGAAALARERGLPARDPDRSR